MDTSAVAAGDQTRSPGRIALAIRDLDPGSFTFVMASGIVSTGAFVLGPSWLSQVLLVAASAGLAVLSVALVIRLVRFRPSVVADIHAPERVFGFFTITAGFDVLGVRFSYAGHPLVTAILGGAAAAGWLVLTYGVPASLLLTRTGPASSAPGAFQQFAGHRLQGEFLHTSPRSEPHSPDS
jgi:tellurite resistance protein TehA-like permease